MQEIFDLKDFFFVILKKWRLLIVLGLLGCIACGLYKAVPMILLKMDPEYMEIQTKMFEIYEQQYHTVRGMLNEEIDDLTQEISRLEEYLESSILMNMNAVEANKSTITFFVDTGYEIAPSQYYQPPDKTSWIIASYKGYVESQEVHRAIVDKLDLDIETKYLSELIKIDPDYDNRMFSIDVMGESEEFCSNVINQIYSIVLDYRSKVSGTIDDFDIVELNRSHQEMVDLSLRNQQQTNRNDLLSISDTLRAKMRELDQTELPVSKAYTFLSIALATIKYLIFGLFGGIALGVVFAFFIDVMSGRVRNAAELSQQFGLKHLGTVTISGREKK